MILMPYIFYRPWLFQMQRMPVSLILEVFKFILMMEMGSLEEFKQLPINIAYPIALFFLTLSKNLMPVTEDYLEKSLQKMSKKLLN